MGYMVLRILYYYNKYSHQKFDQTNYLTEHTDTCLISNSYAT